MDIFLRNIRAHTQVRQVGIYNTIWTTMYAYAEVLRLRRPGNTTPDYNINVRVSWRCSLLALHEYTI